MMFKLSGGLGWLFAFRLSVALKMRLRGFVLGRWGCSLGRAFHWKLRGGGVSFVTTRHELYLFVFLFICLFVYLFIWWLYPLP